MFEKVDIHSLSFNPFDKVGKGWLLISATKNGKTNTMTASWGTLGHLWNKNVAIIFIRPQRYTKEFVDESETFTLSFFDDKHKEHAREFYEANEAQNQVRMKIRLQT